MSNHMLQTGKLSRHLKNSNKLFSKLLTLAEKSLLENLISHGFWRVLIFLYTKPLLSIVTSNDLKGVL